MAAAGSPREPRTRAPKPTPGQLRPRCPTSRRSGMPLDSVDYLVDDGLATALFLAMRLPQPLLLEGEAGVGKTEAAKLLAAALQTPL